MNAAKMIASRGLTLCTRNNSGLLRGTTTMRFRVHVATQQNRFIYTGMSKEEEEEEKTRVAGLSAVQKTSELKEIDRQLSLMNMKRGINTGELYTLRGKFKALARDYGFPFMMWYWTVWASTAVVVYGCIEIGGVDALALIGRVDDYTGWTLASHVNHDVGTIALTIAVNEMIEPLRLPIVVLTTKPVVDALSLNK